MFDLRECEVVHQPSSHWLWAALVQHKSIGKNRSDVGRALQAQVVNGYQNAVFGDGQILFYEIGALLECEAVRLQRVLGRVGACATMGDQLFR